MRSFTLAAFASLTFGIFCSATPTPDKDMWFPYPPRAIAARDTEPADGNSSLQSVLSGFSISVQPFLDKAEVVDTLEDVEAILTPMLQGIVDVLKSTDSQVELLASVPVNESLANPATGDQLDVANIVNLVTIPLVSTLTNVQFVLGRVPGVVKDSVAPLIHEFAEFLAQLLASVLGLVGNLAAEVLGGIHGEIDRFLPFITTLNNDDLLTVLQISS